MNWKEFLKHSFILYSISIIFGLVYSIVSNINLVIFTFLRYNLWPKTIIISIIIPLLYSFFIKKSIKELITITILFILISSIISFPIMNFTHNIAIESEGESLAVRFLGDLFGANPSSQLETAICAPYMKESILAGPGEEVEVCFFQKYNFVVELILISLLSFFIVAISLIIGSSLSRIKK